MKRTALLNRHLSALVASLGHLDEIIVADVGLPVPDGVPVIDLAVTAGVPLFWDVIGALRSELVIESACFANEAGEVLQKTMRSFLSDWGKETGTAVAVTSVNHSELKHRSHHSKAIIRTGECTPYCNIILVSGVPF